MSPPRRDGTGRARGRFPPVGCEALMARSGDAIRPGEQHEEDSLRAGNRPAALIAAATEIRSRRGQPARRPGRRPARPRRVRVTTAPAPTAAHAGVEAPAAGPPWRDLERHLVRIVLAVVGFRYAFHFGATY